MLSLSKELLTKYVGGLVLVFLLVSAYHIYSSRNNFTIKILPINPKKCDIISSDQIQDKLIFAANSYRFRTGSERSQKDKSVYSIGQTSESELIERFSKENIYFDTIASLLIRNNNEIRMYVDFDKNCQIKSFEIFSNAMRSTILNGEYDIIDKAAEAAVFFSSEYYSILSRLQRDPLYARRRALWNFRHGSESEWYANVVGMSYIVEGDDARGPDRLQKLSHASAWFELAISYNPRFLPALSNQIDTNIAVATYSGHSGLDIEKVYIESIRTLLRQYQRNAEPNYLTKIGGLYYKMAVSKIYSVEKFKTRPFQDIDMAIYYLEEEVEMHGGSYATYNQLSEIYSMFLKRPALAEKYREMAKSTDTARQL